MSGGEAEVCGCLPGLPLSLPLVLHAVLGMDEGCSRGRQPMSECLNPPLG